MRSTVPSPSPTTPRVLTPSPTFPSPTFPVVSPTPRVTPSPAFPSPTFPRVSPSPTVTPIGRVLTPGPTIPRVTPTVRPPGPLIPRVTPTVRGLSPNGPAPTVRPLSPNGPAPAAPTYWATMLGFAPTTTPEAGITTIPGEVITTEILGQSDPRDVISYCTSANRILEVCKTDTFLRPYVISRYGLDLFKLEGPLSNWDKFVFIEDLDRRIREWDGSDLTI